MACRGVARQGEDGRPSLVHLVHQVHPVHWQASRRAQTAHRRCHQPMRRHLTVLGETPYFFLNSAAKY